MPEHTPRGSSAARRRTALAAGAAALAGLDLALKTWAKDSLADAPIGPGFAQLRLAYNPGVAFSMGDTLPSWVVIALTALITAGVGVFAWRTAPTSKATAAALAAILAGAAANLIDRTADGVVTDYLHTGWWPTFNLADAFIVCGGIAVAALSWRRTDHEPDNAPA
ncbi:MULTISPECIES: signal peptidase II [Streptomyces]|uniref:Lipoprotein signal peptidase n=1 Tax=Streptomyces zinciresistens K42 TaxID=700597 RepID=G2G5T2_9ACTN|nr:MULTISPECIES: signal peptidase II [Streptomyces]EGX61021.1 putative signal peptidase II [Streptomyces zinciresistens K42]MDT9696548.1 signal peptidase II [Streptomyces sp. P17]